MTRLTGTRIRRADMLFDFSLETSLQIKSRCSVRQCEARRNAGHTTLRRRRGSSRKPTPAPERNRLLPAFQHSTSAPRARDPIDSLPNLSHNRTFKYNFDQGNTTGGVQMLDLRDHRVNPPACCLHIRVRWHTKSSVAGLLLYAALERRKIRQKHVRMLYSLSRNCCK